MAAELPCGSDPLTSEQMARFAATGWVLAPGFFQYDAIAEMSGWIDDLLARPEVPGTHWVYHQASLTDGNRRLVQRIENFCPHHGGFDVLARQSRLSLAVSQLLTAPAVLFKEKINFKEPGGAGFELHQDQQAGWGRYAPLFVTAMICVDPATVENGCLEVACDLARLDHLVADEWRPISDAETGGFSLTPFPTKPGDVIFFDSFVPHASQANTTAAGRRMLFFTYNSLAHGDQRDAYHVAKRASFPPDIERAAGAEYTFRV